MSDQSSSWNDQRMDLLIGDLLRVGVLLSAFVIAFGGLVYLRHQGTALPSYGVFKGEPTDLRTASGIINDVRYWQGRGIIQLGVLILIATPVARVVFLLFAFALERDYLYFSVALLVLAVLGLSIAGQL